MNRDILKVFGHEGKKANNIWYVNWLNMVRAGLLGVEFYSPETGSWRQAHMNARYVIFQVLLEDGDDLVTLKELKGDDGQSDLVVALNRSKIETTGRKAITNFLMKLQLYKSESPVGKDNLYDSVH